METPFAFDPDGLADHDDFYRKGFAARLAKVIQQHPPGECIVVSLTSEWGAGKSSVLRWVRDCLAGEKEHIAETACIPVTDFNPWGVSGERDMLFRLYEKLVTAIELNDKLLSRWQAIKNWCSKNLGRTGKTVSSIASATDQKVTGSLIEGATGLFESLCHVGIAEVRRSVEDRLLKSKWRLAVIIDDIDRLEREDLMILLRLLKREAALPNVTYILSMDESQVAKTIGRGSQEEEDRGRQYLEKIIQVRLHLPTIPPQIIKTFTRVHIERSLNDPKSLNTERFHNVFDTLFLPRISTPRTTKTIANAIRFYSGLLPGEVDITDLALLECARLLYPELYNRIKTGDVYLKPNYGPNTNYPMNHQTDDAPPPYWMWISKAWSDANLGDPSDDERLAMGAWFPQVCYSSIASEEDQFWRDQRLCSHAYHWRYFSHAIIRGDIADADIEELKSVCVKDLPSATAKFRETLTNERGHVAIEKICRLPYTKEEVKGMTKFLVRHFSNETDSVSIAARICVSLSDAAAIEEVAFDVVDYAPINWADAFLDHIPREFIDQRSQQKGHVPNHVRVKLAERQLQRLQDASDNDAETNICDIWSVWHFGAEHTLKETITSRLIKDPSYAYILLASVCARGVAEKPPRIWRWNGRDSINSLRCLVQLESLQLALSKLPQIKENASCDNYRYCAPEELVAHFNSTLGSLEPTVATTTTTTPSQ